MHPFRRSMSALAVAALFAGHSASAQPSGAEPLVVPAQSLQQSLEAVAQRFGLKLQVEPGVAQGRSASAIAGATSAASALQSLLAGSGLRFRISGDTVFVEAAAVQAIEIKGQLLRSSVQRSAASVNVTTGAAIEAAGIRQLDEIYQRAAGVSASYGREGFAVRGMGDSSVDRFSAGGDLSSLIVDGVSLTGDTKRFGPSALWDVEQVEVLRGPQSTNIGRNSLAGAVNVRTRDPEMFFEAEARALLGSYRERQVSGTLNIPLSDAGVALRIAADDARSDGFVSNPTIGTDRFDRQGDRTVRAKLLLEPKKAIPGLRVVATLQSSDNLRSGYDVIEETEGERRINYSDYQGRRRNESTQAALNVDYSLSTAWKLSSYTSFIDATLDSLRDSDQSADSPGAFVGRLNDRRNASQELRLSYQSGRTRGVIGAFVGRDEGTIRLVGGYIFSPSVFGIPDDIVDFYPATLTFPIGGTDLQKVTNNALFAEFEFAVAPGWRLTTGIRHDREKSRLGSSRTVDLVEALPDPSNPALTPDQASSMAEINAFLEDFTSSAPFRTGEASYSAWLPHLTLSRDWTPDLSTSISYKRGYRSGGVELLNFSDEINRFGAETLDNFEVALRSRLMDGKLTFNANAYVGRWKDQQVAVSASSISEDYRTANAGESRISGFEVELQARPTAAVQLFTNVGYSKTRFKRFVSFGEDYSGNRFAGTPEVTASAGLNWHFGSGWFLGGSASYTGDRFTEVDNKIKLDPYTILNLRAGYEAERYSVHLIARNVTDKFIVYDSFTNDNGNQLLQVGAPRTLALEFRARW